MRIRTWTQFSLKVASGTESSGSAALVPSGHAKHLVQYAGERAEGGPPDDGEES